MIQRVIKNVMHAVKEARSVSKSILPIMIIYAFLTVILYLGDLFIIKFIVNYALSETFSIKRLLLYFIAYFCVVSGINIFEKIIIGGYINKFEM